MILRTLMKHKVFDNSINSCQLLNKTKVESAGIDTY